MAVTWVWGQKSICGDPPYAITLVTRAAFGTIPLIHSPQNTEGGGEWGLQSVRGSITPFGYVAPEGHEGMLALLMGVWLCSERPLHRAAGSTWLPACSWTKATVLYGETPLSMRTRGKWFR